MNIVPFLALFSVGIGSISLGAFWWTVRAGQYDDPAGDAARILTPVEDAPLKD
jgi:cbb3-type cytochrome oxidase maturation protein